MPMEAAAVDKLVEKGGFKPDVAIAIAEAVDIKVKGGQFVTVPVFDARVTALDAKMEARFASMDARFAVLDAKLETRFASIEKSISSTKVWAVYLYAGPAISLSAALWTDNHRLEAHQGQLLAHLDDVEHAERQRSDNERQRSDEPFVKERQRSDEAFREAQQRTDRRFPEIQSLLDAVQRGSDRRLEAIPGASAPAGTLHRK